MPLSVVSVGMAMVLLTVTASSGPVRVWVTPAQIRSSPNDVQDPVIIGPQNPVPSDRIALPSWIITLLPFVGALLIVLVVIAVASVGVAPRFAQFGWRRLRWWAARPIAPLPEVIERELIVDVEAALAALSEGTARNAIVACWIQLENDAARVGLQRLIAETPAEYVERVIVTSSVDPAPIKELAALYREARFSRHKMGNHHRARALDALHRVAATLKREHRASA